MGFAIDAAEERINEPKNREEKIMQNAARRDNV